MRYAIYFTPPASSPLWHQGSLWLGRDAHSGHSLPQPRLCGIDPERLANLTRRPRHYGFHATMTPPFRLMKGTTAGQLRDALDDFTSRHRPLTLPLLELAQISDFFCLRPVRHCQPLQLLAAYCIREFDRFRAILTPSEMARRRAAVLNGQEKRNLELWGYPYVFEQYRFHLTLTARMAAGKECESVHRVLAETFNPLLKEPLVIDALSLFVEPAAGQPMRCSHRFPFAGTPPGRHDLTHDQNHTAQDLYPGYQRHPA